MKPFASPTVLFHDRTISPSFSPTRKVKFARFCQTLRTCFDQCNFATIFRSHNMHPQSKGQQCLQYFNRITDGIVFPPYNQYISKCQESLCICSYHCPIHSIVLPLAVLLARIDSCSILLVWFLFYAIYSF